jgi:hypothetical protein
MDVIYPQHAGGPSMLLQGIVPDGVAAVRIREASGTDQRVAVENNGYRAFFSRSRFKRLRPTAVVFRAGRHAHRVRIPQPVPTTRSSAEARGASGGGALGSRERLPHHRGVI